MFNVLITGVQSLQGALSLYSLCLSLRTTYNVIFLNNF